MKAKNLLLILLTIGSMGLFGESNIPCKPPKEVLEIYLNAGEQGKLLTADGWNKASQAFVHPKPFPVNSGFVIVSAKSAAIETFLEDNKVQETVMGYQNLGRVDSQLRYFPPNKTPYVETGVVYRLVLIEKYQRSNTNETKTRLPESACWKIEDTQGPPWAPLAVAIQHVTSIRDKSSNAKVKKNADETLAMLMQLQ